MLLVVVFKLALGEQLVLSLPEQADRGLFLLVRGAPFKRPPIVTSGSTAPVGRLILAAWRRSTYSCFVSRQSVVSVRLPPIIGFGPRGLGRRVRVVVGRSRVPRLGHESSRWHSLPSSPFAYRSLRAKAGLGRTGGGDYQATGFLVRRGVRSDAKVSGRSPWARFRRAQTNRR